MAYTSPGGTPQNLIPNPTQRRFFSPTSGRQILRSQIILNERNLRSQEALATHISTPIVALSAAIQWLIDVTPLPPAGPQGPLRIPKGALRMPRRMVPRVLRMTLAACPDSTSCVSVSFPISFYKPNAISS